MTIDDAKKAFEGVVSHAKQIGDNAKLGTKHRHYKKACESCNPLLNHFNIKEYKIN